jgi:hypothetical protein
MPKSFRPTEDPEWKHCHIPTGEIRICARTGCRTRFPITCHNGRKRLCQTCGGAVKRLRDREHARNRRFKLKLKAADRAGLIAFLAMEYADTGYIDTYQHGSGTYTVKEWNILLDEARTAGAVLNSDEDYRAQVAELAEMEAAEDEAMLASQIARLEQALNVARSVSDALGERIASEQLRVLRAKRG